jgi:hypothetical protein
VCGTLARERTPAESLNLDVLERRSGEPILRCRLAVVGEDMKTSPRLLALALGLFGCGHAVSAPADPCSTPSLDPSLSAKIHAATTRDSDEGMWLLNAFPSERVKQKYGFAPSAEFLDHVRLSSVRLTLGCSGSIVSPSGLVMTNHHCASECLAELSTADRDLIQRGYLAK